MQEIFNFVVKNWQLILSVLIFIASLVVAIIRKRPVDNILSAIYASCVEAINRAEATSLKGDEKLKYCLGIVFTSLEWQYPNIKAVSYYGYIVKVIEEILSTPQKKGGN